MATSKARQRKGASEIDRDLSSSTNKPKSPYTVVKEDIAPDAGLLTLCKIAAFVITFLPALVILIVIFGLKSPIDPVAYSLPPAPKLEGALEPNDLVVRLGKRLYEGRVQGPESIIHQHGHLYTGTADGKILHIEGNNIQTVASLGSPPCGRIEDEPNCGRPLGMRFDKDGYLIVLDTYLGMYKVNVATGDVFQLFPSSMKVEGKSVGFLNDLDIASDGMMYFSDSSVYWRKEFPLDMLEGRPHGRLLMHDPVANSTTQLLDGLYFANGVQLSRDETYLLVVESTRSRIQKYYLKGELKGRAEVFAENLPGTPDNIRLSASGGYWVTIGICRHADKFDLAGYLAPWPWMRKQIAKVPGKYLMSMLAPCGILLHLKEDGTVKRTIQDLDGALLQYMSEVEDDAGVLYIGSFTSPYIGVVDTRRKVTTGA